MPPSSVQELDELIFGQKSRPDKSVPISIRTVSELDQILLERKQPPPSRLDYLTDIITQVPTGVAQGLLDTIVTAGVLGTAPLRYTGLMEKLTGETPEQTDQAIKELYSARIRPKAKTPLGEMFGDVAEFIGPTGLVSGLVKKPIQKLVEGEIKRRALQTGVGFAGGEAITGAGELATGQISTGQFIKNIGLSGVTGALFGGVGGIPGKTMTDRTARLLGEGAALTQTAPLITEQRLSTPQEALYGTILLGTVKGMEAGLSRLSARKGTSVEQEKGEVFKRARAEGKTPSEVLNEDLVRLQEEPIKPLPEGKEMPRAETQGPQGQKIVKPVGPQVVPIQPETPPPPPSALGKEPQPGTTELPGATPRVEPKGYGPESLPRAGEGVTPQPLSEAETVRLMGIQKVLEKELRAKVRAEGDRLNEEIFGGAETRDIFGKISDITSRIELDNFLLYRLNKDELTRLKGIAMGKKVPLVTGGKGISIDKIAQGLKMDTEDLLEQMLLAGKKERIPAEVQRMAEENVRGTITGASLYKKLEEVQKKLGEGIAETEAKYIHSGRLPEGKSGVLPIATALEKGYIKHIPSADVPKYTGRFVRLPDGTVQEKLLFLNTQGPSTTRQEGWFIWNLPDYTPQAYEIPLTRRTPATRETRTEAPQEEGTVSPTARVKEQLPLYPEEPTKFKRGDFVYLRKPKGATSTLYEIEDVYATGGGPLYKIKDRRGGVDWIPEDKLILQPNLIGEGTPPPYNPPPKGPSAPGGEPPKPEDVIKSHISYTTPEQPGTPIGEKLDRAWTAIKDQYRPIQNAVFDITGKENPLPLGADPYIQARLYQGWHGKASTFLERGTFDYETGPTEFTSKGLRDILSPISKDKQDFSAYLIAKAVPAREALGKITGITVKDARTTVESLSKKYPQFETTASEVKIFQRKVLEYYRKAGFIDKETEILFNRLYENYVPFYRELLEGGAGGPAIGKGFGNIPQAVKRAKGSEALIIDPLESLIRNTYALINVAERNRVMRALTDLADRPNAENWIRKVRPDVRPVAQVNAKEIAKQIADSLGITKEKIGLADDKLVTIFRPTKTEGQVWVWKDGKKEYYDVEPTLYKATQALDSQTVNTLIGLLSFPAKMLRAGATLTPEFASRNPIRDAMSAMVYSKYRFIPGVDTLRGLAHVMGKTDTYYRWRASGGEHSMLVSLDRDYLQSNLKTLMASNMGKVKNMVTHPIEMLRILSELTESATRVGEFAKGVAKEGLTPEGLSKAGFASREVTLDFARIGPHGRALNAIIAFWNAHLEGLDKMKRAFMENPARTTTIAVAGITVPSVLLWAVNKDNERIQALPQWQKDLFWLIDTGEVIVRIPKPFELGIIFGTAPERMLDWIVKNDPKALAKIKDSILRGATPGVVPTAAIPFVESYANKSIFRDTPIVPRGKEKLEPYLQYQRNTSEFAKTIGRGLNMSPAKIENFILSYTGGLGRYGLQGIDKLIGKEGQSPEPEKTLADMPVVRAFVARYPSANTEPIEDFYKSFNKAETVRATLREFMKEGNREEAQQYALQNKEFIRQYDLLSSVGERLANYRKVINIFEDSKTMLPAQKRKKIDEILVQMNNLAKMVNKFLLKQEEKDDRPQRYRELQR